MGKLTEPWKLCRIFGAQPVGTVGAPRCPKAGIAAQVIPSQSSRRTFRGKVDTDCRPADLPTCRPADLPTCRPADLPTCRPKSTRKKRWCSLPPSWVETSSPVPTLRCSARRFVDGSDANPLSSGLECPTEVPKKVFTRGSWCRPAYLTPTAAQTFPPPSIQGCAFRRQSLLEAMPALPRPSGYPNLIFGVSCAAESSSIIPFLLKLTRNHLTSVILILLPYLI
jgi:hypothetical protein